MIPRTENRTRGRVKKVPESGGGVKRLDGVGQPTVVACVHHLRGMHHSSITMRSAPRRCASVKVSSQSTQGIRRNAPFDGSRPIAPRPLSTKTRTEDRAAARTQTAQETGKPRATSSNLSAGSFVLPRPVKGAREAGSRSSETRACQGNARQVADDSYSYISRGSIDDKSTNRCARRSHTASRYRAPFSGVARRGSPTPVSDVTFVQGRGAHAQPSRNA